MVFLPPRQAVTVVGVSQQLGLVLYFLVTLTIVGFGQVLRRAKQRTDRAMDGLRQEVAERTRIEASLRETQSALVRAQRTVQAGLWEVDLRSGRLMWSDAYYDVFGLDRTAEPSVETWLGCLHPEDRSHVQREYSRSIEEGRDQSLRWFGTNTDITDLREAQASLIDSEERLRALTGQLEQLVEERTEEVVRSQAELRALATELNLTEQRERKRVAVELHDHLAQMLVLSKLKLSQMKRVPLLAPGCLDLIKDIDDVLAQCLTYTRTLVANLAPPVLHDFGLPAALRWLGEQLSQQGLPVEVDIGRDDLPLPEDQAVLLF